MTTEDKQILLQDLCARLPYGVMCNIRGIDGYDRYIVSVDRDNTKREFEVKVNSDEKEEYMPHTYPLECIKPYLRPMSSMTAGGENIEYQKLVKVIQDTKRTLHWCDTVESIDWLNAHYFDYRGLIEKGLALEAPEGMYEIK